MNYQHLVRIGELAMIIDAIGRDSISTFIIPHVTDHDHLARFLSVVILLDENAWVNSLPTHGHIESDPYVGHIHLEGKTVVSFDRCIMTLEKGLVSKKEYEFMTGLIREFSHQTHNELPYEDITLRNDSTE